MRREVERIVARHCVECHGAERREADLDVRTVDSLLAGGESGPAIVPGLPDASLLLEMIRDELMPPEGELLAPGEVEAVRRWIAAGARP